MNDAFHYDRERVVVTGGAQGIGSSLLTRLAELGATAVTVLDLKTPTGPHDQFIQTGLSDPEQIDAAIQAIEGPVRTLFNNAGVANTSPSDTVFAVNYLAVRRLTDGLIGRISEGGTVVNTASIAGSLWAERLSVILELLAIDEWHEATDWFRARTELAADTYGFTKECLHVYTMWAARAFGSKGIRINAVAPGPVSTGLLPDFRVTMTDALIDWSVSQGDGQITAPDDVACVLAFLGSDASRSVSGTVIPIDRGFMAAGSTGQLDFEALSGSGSDH